MKEKRRAYIGLDVYIGRPGRLPDVECCHLVFCMVVFQHSSSNISKHSRELNERLRREKDNVEK
jgi:hypothetical protein